MGIQAGRFVDTGGHGAQVPGGRGRRTRGQDLRGQDLRGQDLYADGRRVVVGAVIVDDLANPGVVLAARRTHPAKLAGFWEFPGGKVEPGESAEDALRREITEELGAEILLGPEIVCGHGPWAIDEKYCLRLFLAVFRKEAGNAGNSHDELRWLDPSTLDTIRWLPSDAAAIDTVRALLQ